MSGENSQDSFSKDRAELFEALGHPTRIRILELLSDSPKAFSDLKKALDIDSSGQLQFHLGKLHGLVKTVEGNYALTDDGKEAIRIVMVEKPKADLQRITGKRMKLLTVSAIVVLVILATSLGYFAYNYSSQLQNTNRIIQQNFVQRDFNYTIVLSHTESCCTVITCICSVQLSPTIENITLIPLSDARAVTSFPQFNNTPLDNWIYPETLGYKFENGSLNTTSVESHSIIPIANSTFNETIDTTVTYNTYTGQISMLYLKGVSEVVFSFGLPAPPQNIVNGSSSNIYLSPVTFKVPLPP
jgi:DNA-binding transcriptional ArsR family regulator